MSPRSSATLASLLAVSLAVAITGCGGSGGDSTSTGTVQRPIPNQDLTAGYAGAERDAIAAARDYFNAFSRGDQAAVCELTTVGSSPAAIAKCEQTLSSLGPSRQPRFKVAYVKVDGRSAKLLLRPTGSFGDPTLFDLRKVGGEWKTITVSVPVNGAQ